MTMTVVRRRLGPVLLLMVLATVGLASRPAVAEDGRTAWAATPCDETGVPDGRTRFEVLADPGETVEEHLLVTNSSTVEREFAVYGADAFNTPDGGYDLLAAAQVSTDVGSWVSVDAPTVTIPALSTAVVPVTVAVPSTATPGDHAGGVLVSPMHAETTDQGLVVDSRIAVRLMVRVAGELAPSLDVRSVSGSFASTWVPFGSSDATVSYEVVNTGNVMVVGVPRVRLTGPFGVKLAEAEPGETRQVLPGDAFTVTVELDGVAPLLVATAVVDIEMAAAPGPDTEIPLVSSTARATFLAVPWTGLLLVLLVAAGVWFLIRWLRWRRRAGTAMWHQMVAEAAAQQGRDAPGQSLGTATSALALVLLLTAGSTLLSAAPVMATPLGAADDGEVTLTVPPGPPPGPSPTPSDYAPVPAPTPPRWARIPSPTPEPTATPTPSPRPDAPDAVASDRMPDLLWVAGGPMTPLRWALVVLAAGVAGVAGTVAVRMWRRRGASGPLR